MNDISHATTATAEQPVATTTAAPVQSIPAVAVPAAVATPPPPAAVTSGSPRSLFSGLTSNPLFAGGVGIAGLGVGAALLRRGLLSGMLFAQRHLTVSLEIPSKDRSYGWVLHWLHRHTAYRAQHMSVETTVMQQAGGQVNATFDFLPSTGKHFFWFRKR